MTTLDTATPQGDLAKALTRVTSKGERVIVRRRGKDVAALVSLDDLALLERLEDYFDRMDAREALKEAKEKGTIPLERILAEMEL